MDVVAGQVVDESIGPPVPASLLAIAATVEDRLRLLLDAEVQRWTELDPDLTEPLAALQRLVLSGGKRVRPAFCHWGWVAAGGDPDDARIVDAGAAFELLQAFALVHDDVMDDSDTRRGATTIHLEFAAQHRQAGWRGDPRRFGEAISILAGDLAHVFADQMMAGANARARGVWDELRIELNVGQYLDVLGTAQGYTDAEHARRIIRYKTGRYTIERPLHLGAALAEGTPELDATLSAYGEPLGEAFQLRDDILGAFGDSGITGKPVGDDLREGKPTPLLAEAVARADVEQRALLARVGADDLDEPEVLAIQQVLEATGARQAVETDIEQLTDQAVAAIEASDVPRDARTELVALARYVAVRER